MNNAQIDLSNCFADAVEKAGRSVVSVNEGGRAGVSGTLWRDSLVITAEHTIRGHEEVTVDLPDGTTSTANVIGRDPATDIALLRTKDGVPAVVEFADTSELRVGNYVLAIGRRGKRGLAASHGIISTLGGQWRTWRGGRIDQWFRLDLIPFTGFSGGPLIDVAAKVIGINTSGPQRSVVTLPATTVNRTVDLLLAKGRIPRGFLGIALQPVQLPARASTDRGMLVIAVEPGGPAEKAGVMVGDILVAIGGQPLSDSADLRTTIDPDQVGKTVQLRVLRGGQEREASLTVAERPDEP